MISGRARNLLSFLIYSYNCPLHKHQTAKLQASLYSEWVPLKKQLLQQTIRKWQIYSCSLSLKVSFSFSLTISTGGFHYSWSPPSCNTCDTYLCVLFLVNYTTLLGQPPPEVTMTTTVGLSSSHDPMTPWPQTNRPEVTPIGGVFLIGFLLIRSSSQSPQIYHAPTTFTPDHMQRCHRPAFVKKHPLMTNSLSLLLLLITDGLHWLLVSFGMAFPLPFIFPPFLVV